jgi:hypothetical protein
MGFFCKLFVYFGKVSLKTKHIVYKEGLGSSEAMMNFFKTLWVYCYTRPLDGLYCNTFIV